MQLGQVVDFCISYNERMERAEKEASKESASGKGGGRKRKATQADINAFFG